MMTTQAESEESLVEELVAAEPDAWNKGDAHAFSTRCTEDISFPRLESPCVFCGLFFHSEHVVVGREVVHQDSYFLILHSERKRAHLRCAFAPMFLISEAVYSSCSRSFSCMRNVSISCGKSCGTS